MNDRISRKPSFFPTTAGEYQQYFSRYTLSLWTERSSDKTSIIPHILSRLDEGDEAYRRFGQPIFVNQHLSDLDTPERRLREDLNRRVASAAGRPMFYIRRPMNLARMVAFTADRNFGCSLLGGVTPYGSKNARRLTDIVYALIEQRLVLTSLNGFRFWIDMKKS